MIPKELFQKVRQIEITTSRLVTDVFAGQYHSVFKGQGIEFEEVREYQIGDDVRSIDWNVTARTGRPHIKKFKEERELTVMVLVDASMSMQFSTTGRLKSQLAAEIAAVLTLSAIRNNDKVGLIIFTDEIEIFIPPRKGVKHVLRIIREVLYFSPKKKKTNIVQALEYLNKVSRRKTIVFLISDFLATTEIQSGQLKKTLSAANKRHDLTAIALDDPQEMAISSLPMLMLEDAESGETVLADASSPTLRKEFNIDNQGRISTRRQLFHSIGMDCIDIATNSSCSDEMVKFFYKRRRRLRA